MENCYHQHIDQETALEIIFFLNPAWINKLPVNSLCSNLNPSLKNIKKKTRANVNTKKASNIFWKFKSWSCKWLFLLLMPCWADWFEAIESWIYVCGFQTDCRQMEVHRSVGDRENFPTANGDANARIECIKRYSRSCRSRRIILQYHWIIKIVSTS